MLSCVLSCEHACRICEWALVVEMWIVLCGEVGSSACALWSMRLVARGLSGCGTDILTDAESIVGRDASFGDMANGLAYDMGEVGLTALSV